MRRRLAIPLERLDFDMSRELVEGKASDALLSGVTAVEDERTLISLGLGPGRDSEEPVLEFRTRHADPVVLDQDSPVLGVLEVPSLDVHGASVGIVGILDQLDECGRFPPDEQFAELSKQLGIDREFRHKRFPGGLAKPLRRRVGLALRRKSTRDPAEGSSFLLSCYTRTRHQAG